MAVFVLVGVVVGEVLELSATGQRHRARGGGGVSIIKLPNTISSNRRLGGEHWNNCRQCRR